MCVLDGDLRYMYEYTYCILYSGIVFFVIICSIQLVLYKWFTDINIGQLSNLRTYWKIFEINSKF